MNYFFSILILSCLSSSAFARGLNGSSQNLGGIQVDDPHENLNKNSPSRKDIEKAKELMAQFGYGKTANKSAGTQQSTGSTTEK